MKKASTVFHRLISPGVLIVAGVAAIPSFLFQSNLILQIVQVATFFIAAAALGKRIRLLPPLIMLVSITLLNIFTPIGKVLFSVGRFSITLGALRLGLQKALTLIGLIYLSRATVRSDLRLPGKFGSIITKTFYYFDQIYEKWSTIPRQPIIKRLDALLTSIYGQERLSEENNREKQSMGLPGYCIIAVFLLVQWSLFSMQFILSWDLFR